jgi:hypothetical protein
MSDISLSVEKGRYRYQRNTDDADVGFAGVRFLQNVITPWFLFI